MTMPAIKELWSKAVSLCERAGVSFAVGAAIETGVAVVEHAVTAATGIPLAGSVKTIGVALKIGGAFLAPVGEDFCKAGLDMCKRVGQGRVGTALAYIGGHIARSTSDIVQAVGDSIRPVPMADFARTFVPTT